MLNTYTIKRCYGETLYIAHHQIFVLYYLGKVNYEEYATTKIQSSWFSPSLAHPVVVQLGSKLIMLMCLKHQYSNHPSEWQELDSVWWQFSHYRWCCIPQVAGCVASNILGVYLSLSIYWENVAPKIVGQAWHFCTCSFKKLPHTLTWVTANIASDSNFSWVVCRYSQFESTKHHGCSLSAQVSSRSDTGPLGRTF